MSKLRPNSNPFYVVLVLAGTAFAVTACAYGVMTVRGLRPAIADAPESELMVFLARQGGTLLLAEVGVLALASLLAISTDPFWMRRAESRSSNSHSPDPNKESNG